MCGRTFPWADVHAFIRTLLYCLLSMLPLLVHQLHPVIENQDRLPCALFLSPDPVKRKEIVGLNCELPARHMAGSLPLYD
jgi:hypothetical protein